MSEVGIYGELMAEFAGKDAVMNYFYIAFLLAMIFLLIGLIKLLRAWFPKIKCKRTAVNFLSILEQKLVYSSVLRAVLETYLMVSLMMWY